MLINTVVQGESKRNEIMIAEYKNLIDSLPKGSLVCRKSYYYLKYRENGKVCDKYIGKDKTVLEDIRNKLELRKHYIDMLNLLEQEQKTIKKVLEELL